MCYLYFHFYNGVILLLYVKEVVTKCLKLTILVKSVVIIRAVDL